MPPALPAPQVCLHTLSLFLHLRRSEIDAAYLEGEYKHKAIGMFDLQGEEQYKSFLRIVLKMQVRAGVYALILHRA